MIDDKIELKVLKIRGSQVHLGIEAPRQAAVHRKEVWLRIQDGSADGVGAAGTEDRPSAKPLASGKARVSAGK